MLCRFHSFTTLDYAHGRGRLRQLFPIQENHLQDLCLPMTEGRDGGFIGESLSRGIWLSRLRVASLDRCGQIELPSHRLIIIMSKTRKHARCACSSVEAKRNGRPADLKPPSSLLGGGGSSIPILVVVGLNLSAGDFSVGNLIPTSPRGTFLGAISLVEWVWMAIRLGELRRSLV